MADCSLVEDISRGAISLVAAPMVSQSELCFRLMVRKYGTQLTFSPMLLAKKFVCDLKYRADTFTTDVSERPLVVQLASSNADVDFLVRAAREIERRGVADAIDLNLGCPQDIARRGGYGAFTEHPASLVRSLCVVVQLPIFVKVRLCDGDGASQRISATIAKCRELVEAGARVVTVHGRTRGAREDTPCDWAAIRAVAEALNVPVIANGDVLAAEDVERCLQETGASAVMAARGLLMHPDLFLEPRFFNSKKRRLRGKRRHAAAEEQQRQCDLACEYLKMARLHPPCSPEVWRQHVYWICMAQFQHNTDCYDSLIKATSLDVAFDIVELMGRRAQVGVTFVRPRMGGRPRKTRRDGMLAPPAIGGLGKKRRLIDQ